MGIIIILNIGGAGRSEHDAACGAVPAVGPQPGAHRRLLRPRPDPPTPTTQSRGGEVCSPASLSSERPRGLPSLHSYSPSRERDDASEKLEFW